MDFENLPNAFQRQLGRHYTDAISHSFINHFSQYGLKQEQPVPISSGVDKTVHLVGAAIKADTRAGQFSQLSRICRPRR